MPRPPRPLDPAGGPLQGFAADLRKLRLEAGEPTYACMARSTGRSTTALSDAAAGVHLPTWTTVQAFVCACKGNPADWKPRWAELRTELGHPREEAPKSAEPRKTDHSCGNVPKDDFETAEDFGDIVSVEDTGDREPSAEDLENGSGSLSSLAARGGMQSRVQLLRVGVPAALLLFLLLVGTTAYSRQESADMPVSAPGHSIVVIQNKVAEGSTVLVENSAGPAYLSTKARPYCARERCKVEGTELNSGAVLRATCYRHGVEMFNYNMDSSAVQRNPHRVHSDVWYHLIYPNGKSGLLSEVYIEEKYRGGLGLPECGMTQ